MSNPERNKQTPEKGHIRYRLTPPPGQEHLPPGQWVPYDAETREQVSYQEYLDCFAPKGPTPPASQTLWSTPSIPTRPKAAFASSPKQDAAAAQKQREKEASERYIRDMLERHKEPADGGITLSDRIEQAERRLASVQAQKAQRQKDQKQNEAQIAQYKKANKLLYFNQPDHGWLGAHGKWEFNPKQKELFEAFKTGAYRVFYAAGANRIGKTFSNILMALTIMDGKFPWEPEERRGWVWHKFGWTGMLPIKGRIVGQDWEKHIKTVIIPDINSLAPKSWNLQVKKNTIGVDAYWFYPTTGATLEIMSNNSESALFEGWHGHFCLFDEPPRREVRVACARGLIDYQGIEGFFMTLLKEAWVDKEVINASLPDGSPDPTVYGVEADINVNVGFGLTKEGIDQFAKALKDDEKEARLRGVPAYKAGLVLNFDRKKHVVKPFSIPSHWPVDVHIDIGVSKPHDIIYVATSPRGFKYVCFEENLKGDGTMIGDSIIKKQQRHHLRLNRIICDPLAKSDQNNENSTYDLIDIHLRKFMCPITYEAYFLETGSKDKEDGVRRINDGLDSINGIPTLFFFSDCQRAITQCKNLMYDKKSGKIQKVEDDMFEGLYRIMLLDTSYTDPENAEAAQMSASTSQTRNSTTGY